jgi:hypothetical protein
VRIDGAGTSGNVVLGNLIGTDWAGTAAIPNTSGGVAVTNGAADNTIGGAAGNVIAYNVNDGVNVAAGAGTGNAVLGNAIHGNTGLGIDLGNDGVTPNDLADADGGANALQNFPVLTGATTNGLGTFANFAGSLAAPAAVATYRIEFFASAAADPTGFGEGQRYLGATNVTTDASGYAVIGASLPASLAAGESVTATATPAAGPSNTSEFSAAIAAQGSLVVTTTADTAAGSDTSSLAALVQTPGADGRISLREAITAANNTPGTDTIRFGIPLTDGGHVYYADDGAAGFSAPVATALADLPTASSPVISNYDADYPAGTARSWYLVTLGSALPDITSPVVLDTTTQPFSVPGTGPVVELNGAAGGNNALALMAGSDGSTVRGFVINRSPIRSILIRASSNNVVAGNFLGTNAAGTAPGPGATQGIFIGGTAPTNDNRVGGTVPADRNVISGNTVDGVDICPVASSTAGNVVQGNHIGTDVTGTVAVPNTNQGVAVFNNGLGGTNTGNVIGGTAPGAGNVISGNGGAGVLVRDPETTGTRVEGNKIGTNAAGTAALGNGDAGVLINVATSGNIVGGSAPAARNVIAYNNSDDNPGYGGIRFAAGTGNAILGNSIYANTRLGIDLGGDGVTVNDGGDGDTGPNDLLNFPSFPPPVETAGTLAVTYGLDVPAGWYRVEFFKNASGADPSGYGEGQAFASSVVVSHPGGGTVAYGHSFPGIALEVISATVTACTDGAACTSFGSTSEFGRAWAAVTTAVGLMSFTAAGGDESVDLAWRTGSELDNLGFHLYRSLASSGPWTRITPSLVPGLGSSPIGASYSWHDSGLVNGTRYYYRLEDVDTRSASTFHGPVSSVPSSPGEDGDGGGGEDGTERGSPGASSCPSWILSAAPDAVSPRCTRHGDPDATSLRLLDRDDSTATLELRTGGFWALHEGAALDSGFASARGRPETVRVFVPGLEFPTDPGSPALPIRRALVEAVVGKGVELVSAEAFDVRSFAGLRPSAVGMADMAVGRDGTVRPSRRAAPAARSRETATRQVARLAGTVFQGEKKSAVVELAPVRYAGWGQGLELASRVRVKLGFTGEVEGESGAGSRGRVGPVRRTLFPDVLARLFTTERGLHAVSYEALFPGRPRGFSTRLLRLQRQGEAVAFRVEPRAGAFGPGSTLYFHADRTAGSTEYSPEVAYELVRSRDGVQMSVGAATPVGAEVVSAATGSASFEVNRIYQPGLLEAEDVWLWQAAMSTAAPPEPAAFSLEGVASSSGQPARLVVHLQGGSESGATTDHHVRVLVNDVEVGEATFGGKRPYRLEASLPASLLTQEPNRLSLVNEGDMGVYSLVFLDRFEVSYPQVAVARGGLFEGVWSEGGTAVILRGTGLPGSAVILRGTGLPGPEGSAVSSFRGTASSAGAEESAIAADSSGPVSRGVPRSDEWLTGFETTPSAVRFQVAAGERYLVVSRDGLLAPRVARVPRSTLRDGTNQADYLVIAPGELMDAASPLVERRQSQGLRSREVSFEEIASEFGHGQPSAEAIRNFLEYAYHSWQRPSPRYVVLLGDATYDPQRFVGTSWPSPLPALWTKTSYLWTASDPLLGAVNGDDALPDLAIGRLPATTREQAEALVAKVLSWEETGQGLGGRAVLVADDPDQGGDFEWDVEDIRSSFLSGRPTTTLKLRELGSAMRPAILGAFDSGASLMSYVGHGGTAVWASENVLNTWDAPSLLAQSRQPFLLTMNCLNGYFVAPNFDSLPEALLKAQGRGAVAAFSPSGLSLDGPAHQYHRALMGEITSGTHARLGDAILAAQREYAEAGLMPELLSVYHLLGDPATRVR